jgi:large subunit ribosomal protein L18
MARYKTKKEQRERRHRRLRQKVSGTADCPRLSVCTTSKHFYAQFIDDDAGTTLASVSTLDPQSLKDGIKANVEGAEKLGKLAAEKATEAKIKKTVFDRGGFKYHGMIKAFADSVRKGGIEF